MQPRKRENMQQELINESTNTINPDVLLALGKQQIVAVLEQALLVGLTKDDIRQALDALPD